MNDFSNWPYLKKASFFWIISSAILIAILSFWGTFIDAPFADPLWSSITISVVFSLTISFYAIRFWNSNFIEEGKKDHKRKNPYRKMFFGSVNALSFLLLVIGLTGAFLLLFSDDGRNHAYEAMGLVIIIVWAVIFLRYFIWAIYYYNINFGITDKDWDKIFDAMEDKENGIQVNEERLKAPKFNPYRSQTFGLPPGTVRGMIALTLLFGAISMLIVSMGMNDTIEQDSFFWDHFEFYKTAFLMMIAFYFGDRSLKYLQKRWPSVQQAKLKNSQLKKNQEQPDDEIAEDDEEFAAESGLKDNIFHSSLPATSLKNILVDSESEDNSVEDAKEEILNQEFVHIKDSERKKKLDNDLIESVAENVGSEYAALKAIIDVEAEGSGFLNDGRPKILFEGHKFWYWLEEFGEDPTKLIAGNENILYKKWTRKYYLGGVNEYKRFQKAWNIHKLAAVYSTSWGLFQVLGENFNPLWGPCKGRLKEEDKFKEWKDKLKNSEDIDEIREYEDKIGQYYLKDSEGRLVPDDFLAKQESTELNHLCDFIEFISNKKTSHNLKKKTSLLELIKKKRNGDYNWSAFAYGYNGAGYKQNNYHVKLQRAYEKYKNT